MTLTATPNNQPPEDCLSLEGPDPPKQNETTPKTSPGSTPTFPNRRDSQYLTSSPVSSHVFLIGFYEQILKAKSTHRFHELRESTQRALDLAKSEGFSRERAQLPHNLEVVLQPMLAACKTDSKTLTLIGLDGLSKLITYGYLSDQPLFSAKDARDCSPIEMAVLAICGCFKGEATEDKVQTQIIKGLMAAVASTTTVIHQEALLNAIRTLYNIFLLSRDVSNQTIAQGTLLQMSRSVFGRIEAPEPKTWPNSGKSLTFAASRTKFSDAPETSLPAFDEESDEDGPQEEPLADERLTLEALGGKAAEAAANAQAQGNLCDASSDLNVLDGFLLFRALCKLSIKPYQPDA
ncbi:guanine nucleotide exchange protein for ADP-robosylation factor [Massospora cicadina]|nr:guanine nucleotide exchange protein for ADP-robosylation factor [Massospora cicadina]